MYIISNGLDNWAKKYFVYIEAQVGFRGEMGTVDNICVLHGLISHMINNNKKLYSSFIDFSKAFDYVVRSNLWQKLLRLGFRGNLLNVLRSMYECIKSRVKVSNSLSN